MKQLVGALAAALALAWSAGAGAQALNAEQAAGYCTAEGAFGERFGADSVNGRAQGRIMNSQRVTPAQPYPPFGDLEVTFTHLSQRVHTINAVVRYADERAALAAQDQLNAEESQAFALAMLEDAGFQRHFEATMGGLMAVLSGLQSTFDENRDERSRCAAGLTTLDATLQMARDGQAHWTYTAGLYDAEARRRGGMIE